MISTRRVFMVIASTGIALVFSGLWPRTGVAGFIQTYQTTGHVNLEVGGAASLGMPASGTVTLANLPTGIIKQAYLYATQTNNTLGLSATFNGGPLPTAAPYANEALLVTLSTYRWDVTASVIPGVGSYSVAIFDATGSPVPVAGVALVVVWENAATEPVRTVTIVDGVKQVGESGAETESMTFASVPAGSTSVWVFTTDDDASTGETVSYNGSAIGGPLDGNLGLNASVLKMTGTSVLGANMLSVSTLTDHLTWVVGATVVRQGTVPTLESTWGGLKARFR